MLMFVNTLLTHLFAVSIIYAMYIVFPFQYKMSEQPSIQNTDTRYISIGEAFDYLKEGEDIHF